MMKKQKNSAETTDKHDRRRGRPAGRNRTPLSLEERRARNAQYERERRNETADAMSQLAEAARCDPQIANAELLATVISQLQRRAKRKLPQDIEDLKRINENLESQIASLQSRLGQNVNVENDIREGSNDCNPDQLSDASGSNYQLEETNRRASKSQTSRSEPDILPTKSEVRRSNKIRKTSKSSSVKEEITFESDSDDSQSDSDSSNSDWSENVKTEPTSYRLRKRSPKVSELSERTTSTYLGTESESSHCEAATKPHNEHQSDESNQADASELFRASEHPTNVPNDALSVIPENEENTTYDDQTETALLDILTEGEQQILNEWLDCSESLDAETDYVDNRVRKFLDFDDFFLDMNV